MPYNLVLSHSRCPRCAELGNDNHADNLATFSDGHAYCFACHFYMPSPNSIDNIKKKLDDPNTARSTGPMGSPEEYNEYFLTCTTKLPIKAVQWLCKYDITIQEALDKDLYYDLESDLLIFPIKNNQYKLVGYNARNFSGTGPKYISKGDLKNNPQYMISGVYHGGQTIYVYTEDFISAMKVSRQFHACPIFGTNLHTTFFFPSWANQIAILWLDFDKAKESIKQTSRLRQFYPNTFSLITKKDPKEYTDKEINAFVLDCIARST